MLIRIFRENQVFTILLSILISLGILILTAINSSFHPGFNNLYHTPFFQLLPFFNSINNNLILSTAINLLFVLLSGFYISGITVKYQIIPTKTYLPLFLFLIISIPYFKEYNGLSYSLITVSVLLIVIDMLFSTLESKGIAFKFFDSAFFLSCASLFNFYLVFFIVFVVFILIQFKGFRLREFVFIILGSILPYIFLIAFLYLFNEDIGSYFDGYKNMFQTKTIITSGNFLLSMAGFILLMLLIASLQILRNYVKMKIVTRKYSLIFLGLFVVSILLIAFYPTIDRDILFYIALSLSFLFSYYFSTCRINVFNQVLFALLIAGCASLLFLN